LTLYSLNGRTPKIDESAFVADEATVVGAVEVGPLSSVWMNAVLRGDVGTIKIGSRSNIQDGCVIHAHKDEVVELGDGVTVGHGAILHGCTLGNNIIVGMAAVVMDGARVEDWVVIGAGAVVPSQAVVSSKSLALGVPSRVARKLTEEDLAHIERNAEEYVEQAKAYKALKRVA